MLVPSDVGSIVHYVLDRGTNKGECRAAIVIRVWPELQGIQRVNLQVFIDGASDEPTSRSPYILYKTSIDHSSSKIQGKWHDPVSCHPAAREEAAEKSA